MTRERQELLLPETASLSPSRALELTKAVLVPRPRKGASARCCFVSPLAGAGGAALVRRSFCFLARLLVILARLRELRPLWSSPPSKCGAKQHEIQELAHQDQGSLGWASFEQRT